MAAALPLLVSLLWAGSSRADPATAEALFVEGRRLLDAGRYDEACATLAESRAQDPASGTEINLALCYEKQGKLATAWAHYRLAATMSRRDAKPDREAAAEAKVAELEPLLARLTLRSAQQLADLEVAWGELKVGAAALNTTIPVDAGEHELVFKAPGYRAASLLVSVKAGEARVVDLPTLTPQPSPTPAPAPAPAPPLPASPPGAPPGRPVPTAALVLGGTGLILLGVGTYFGVSALSSYGAADDLCPTHQACTDDALAERDKAGKQAWVANIALGAGLLATGGAVYLWLTRGPQPRVSARITISPESARLALGARF